MESTPGLSSSPSNCSRILSRVISVLSKKEEVEEGNSSTFYLSGLPLKLQATANKCPEKWCHNSSARPIAWRTFFSSIGVELATPFSTLTFWVNNNNIPFLRKVLI